MGDTDLSGDASDADEPGHPSPADYFEPLEDEEEWKEDDDEELDFDPLDDLYE